MRELAALAAAQGVEAVLGLIASPIIPRCPSMRVAMAATGSHRDGRSGLRLLLAPRYGPKAPDADTDDLLPSTIYWASPTQRRNFLRSTRMLGGGG